VSSFSLARRRSVSEGAAASATAGFAGSNGIVVGRVVGCAGIMDGSAPFSGSAAPGSDGPSGASLWRMDCPGTVAPATASPSPPFRRFRNIPRKSPRRRPTMRRTTAAIQGPRSAGVAPPVVGGVSATNMPAVSPAVTVNPEVAAVNPLADTMRLCAPGATPEKVVVPFASVGTPPPPSRDTLAPGSAWPFWSVTRTVMEPVVGGVAKRTTVIVVVASGRMLIPVLVAV